MEGNSSPPRLPRSLFSSCRLRHAQVCKASAVKHGRDLAQGARAREPLAVLCRRGGLSASLPVETDRLHSLRPSLDRGLQRSLRGDHQV